MKIAITLALAACAGSAFAQPVASMNAAPINPGSSPQSMLWDQFGPINRNVVDQNFSDFPTFSSYTVDDFTTAGQTWNLTSVRSVYYGGAGNWSGVTSANISIFNKVSGLPGGADAPGVLTAPVTVTGDATNGYIITADVSGLAQAQGLNGDYWIGITPIAAFGASGQQFQGILTTSVFGDSMAIRNPGGGFGFAAGSDWTHLSGAAAQFTDGDCAFQLEGRVVPAPASLALVGLSGLALRRRRTN